MPDHTHDPIRDLENFGTGGLIVNPLEPEEVRRLGDRHRARRRASMLVAAASVAVVVSIVPVALLVGRDDAAPTPPVTTTTPTPTPSPSPSPSSVGLGNIPETFPLDVDAPDYSGDGGDTFGPGPSVETETPSLCDHDAISTAEARGRLGFRVTGPELAEDRELRTFKDENAATAVMAALRKDLDECSTWPTDAVSDAGSTINLTVTRFPADTGHDSETFAVTEVAPDGESYAIGGTVFQVTRVGSAILTLAHGGEVSAHSAPSAGPELIRTTRKITPEMCLFTEAGCKAPTADPRTVTYQDDGGDYGGVGIFKPADLPKLRGAPEDFKQFVLAELAVLEQQPACPPADPREDPHESDPVIIVSRVSTAGYAYGTTGGCEGRESLWAVRDGRWKEVIETHEIWDCKQLEAEGVPISFVGGCYGKNGGDFGPDAVDGISIGMTAADVGALGASVVPGPGRCDFLFQAATDPPPAQSDIADTDGLVSGGRVVAIRGFDNHRTPEGIGNGSSRDEVERVYPQGHLVPGSGWGGVWVVPLAGGNQYRFYVSAGKEGEPAAVFLMELSQAGTTCLL